VGALRDGAILFPHANYDNYSFVCLSPTRKRTYRAMARLAQTCNSAAAMSGCSDARPPGPRVSQTFLPPWKTSP